MNTKQHLSQVLGIVAAINGNGTPPTAEIVSTHFPLADRPAVLGTIADAILDCLLEVTSTATPRLWITSAGGDLLDAAAPAPVPLEVLAVHSDGDLT